jgi:hypothetical protein
MGGKTVGLSMEAEVEAIIMGTVGSMLASTQI